MPDLVGMVAPYALKPILKPNGDGFGGFGGLAMSAIAKLVRLLPMYMDAGVYSGGNPQLSAALDQLLRAFWPATSGCCASASRFAMLASLAPACVASDH